MIVQQRCNIFTKKDDPFLDPSDLDKNTARLRKSTLSVFSKDILQRRPSDVMGLQAKAK